MKKLYAVGLGPGDGQTMTPQAVAAIEESQVICGYTVYIDLIRPLCQGKEVITTAMTREIDRCRMALEQAAAGKTTAMVCSGDAGVYGMASLLLELGQQFPEVEIEAVAGVTAALSGGALLGAPLAHDFAVISLSDLLTPWPLIEKRLAAAAQADFVLCLYNPRSKKRVDYLKKACDIVMRSQSPETVCGLAWNIGRPGQQTKLTTLARLPEEEADMFTTVFIGNSQTRALSGRMVTPRGYENKGR